MLRFSGYITEFLNLVLLFDWFGFWFLPVAQMEDGGKLPDGSSYEMVTFNS
jgi:hypothetical protein